MAFPPPPGKARSSKDERRPAPHSFFRHPGEGGDLAGASGGEGEIVFQSHVPLNTLRRDDKIGFTFVPAPAKQIGRAHVCTPVTNAQLVCRLLLEQKKKTNT